MKKPGVVILIMLLGLAFTGVAYGGWSCIVKMKADVKTGELSVGVRGLTVNDTGPDPLWCSGPNQDDDVGSINCEDGPYLCKLDGEAYAESMDIFIRGYHSYAPGYTFEIANGGTIPAKIKGILFSWEGDLARSIQLGRWSVDYHSGDRLSGSGRADLVKALGNSPLDPGQKMWVEIEFQVNKGAPDEKKIASVVRNALLSVVATRTAEASGDDPPAGSDDAPADTAQTTPSSDVGAGDTDSEDAAGDAPADTTPTKPSGDVDTGDTDSEDAAGDAPAGTAPTTAPGDVDAGDIGKGNPLEWQNSVSTESEPSLNDSPTGKAPSDPGMGILEKPEVAAGHAYGILTITYSRWNECDNDFSQYLKF